MSICAIIDELKYFTKPRTAETGLSLSYFFCGAAIPRLSNATSVLKGLLYMLIRQQPLLISHFSEMGMLEIGDWDSGANIQKVFAKVLADPSLQSTYFIVDALDECLIGSDVLLDFIARSANSPIRWIVSSLNEGSVHKALSDENGKLSLSLERHEQQVSQAVNSYIKYQVCQLKRKKIKDDDLKRIQVFLSEHSHGTFQQVSLVCQNLSRSPPWEIVARSKKGMLMGAGCQFCSNGRVPSHQGQSPSLYGQSPFPSMDPPSRSPGKWLDPSFEDFLQQVRTYLVGVDLNCFLDQKAYITICCGNGDRYSRCASWEEVTELTNFIFESIVFGEEKEEWQVAGRLFLALCIIRTERKPDPEQFTYPRAVRQVTAARYLGYALRCFNSGLSDYFIDMDDKAWRRCLDDQSICPVYAKMLGNMAQEMYELRHSQDPSSQIRLVHNRYHSFSVSR